MEIIIDHVFKTIKGIEILKDVNLELSGGKVYGFQGPNGSGKTMLMRLIAGLIRPTVGSVWIDGKQLGKHMDFPESMGLMIENPAFLPNHTGLKNLELLAQIQGRISFDEVKQAIAAVGLEPGDKRTFRKYSLGMKQRLGVACAIMEKPELLILDEPTNALDESGVDQICKIIRHERDRGALVIISCHDGELLENLADEIYTIAEGNVKKREIYPLQAE